MGPAPLATAAAVSRWRLMLAVVGIPLALWAAGFGWFVHRIAQPAASQFTASSPHADGIVVLTGAPGRVEAALHLLADGRADRLLISGVGPAASFAELARRAGVDPALSSRTTLGRAAHSTRGNALETADWVRQFGVRRLIVVTSSYHMPRALAELSRVLPDTALAPDAVAPDAAGWRLLVNEFNKYLAVVGGLRWLAERDEKEAG